MIDFTGLEQGKRLTAEHLLETQSEQARESQFFNASDLKAILLNPGCMGIRFYPYKNDNEPFMVIAVGVLSDRSEIKSGPGERGYVQSTGASPSNFLTRNEVKGIVGNAMDFNDYSAYFSKADINDLLSNVGCIGIRIYTDSWEVTNDDLNTNRVSDLSLSTGTDPFPTLGIAAVGSDMKNLSDESYILSDMPCPPDCGDDPDYALKILSW